jgi:hypothetical protein
MLRNPKPGQQVKLWYGVKTRATMPLHGKVGEVIVANGKSRGPRNHLEKVDGLLHTVPAGNLMAVADE